MSEPQYRYYDDSDGVQRRYFELRYDEDNRRISGTAMRYGDVAKLPWGDKERFEPGAFGEVAGLDVLLNIQHDRGRPIARTTGGTMRLTDSAGELRIEADLPEGDPDAAAALAKVRAGVLRGFSVEFIPEESDRDGDTITHKRVKLPAIGLVDRPAYPKSRVLRSEADMKPEEIKALIERTVKELTEKRSDTPPDTAAIVAAVSGAVAEQMSGMVTAERAQEMVTEAVETRAAELTAEFEQRMGDHKKKMEEKAKDDEEMMQKKADDRADLLAIVKPLLPDGTETRGQTDHALLVLAVGDEVSDAANRSEDYLRAKVETIAERRAQAANPQPAPAGDPSALPPGVDMTRFIEQRHQRAASA